MSKFTLILSTILMGFIGFSFAANPSIINYSYTTNGDDVTLFWTNNSNGGNMDISLQNPDTQEWLNFDTIAMSDEYYTYTKQRPGDQNIRLIPEDGGEEVKLTVPSSETVARTVITATPKTGPSGHTIAIIIATSAIFGGYIFLKKNADI